MSAAGWGQQDDGACCFFEIDGSECLQATAADCAAAGGDFLGVGMMCTGNACTGACCVSYDDGCVGNVTPSWCPYLDGTFQGYGVSCNDAACPSDDFGTCCYFDFQQGQMACVEVPQSACGSGNWGGPGSTCNGALCNQGACCLPDGQCSQMPIDEFLECQAQGGVFHGPGSSCNAVTCKVAPPCAADLTDNGSVGPEDLAALLAAWGTTPGGPPDFDGNNIVGPEDLAELLANWGQCG